ncbi:MAG: hypothetical protein RBS99_12085 [Rhodospirillales bacterium]|jgi:hypothetical protein|nr:hypothetical protein [Rhodospirillales bacterium]
MAEMLRVKNWSKYQHYKDRNPPWIKLHVEILASEDWVMLADASRLLALVCMVVAAKHDGMVPNNPAYIRRVAYLDKTPNLKPLIECGFLEKAQADDSTAQAHASAVQATARPETETETEKERKKDTPYSPTPENAFDRFWSAYPHRGKLPDPKKPAREKFDRKVRNGIDPETIIAGARRYAGLVRAENIEGRLVCMASTWLNQERWDEGAAPGQPSPAEDIEARRAAREAERRRKEDEEIARVTRMHEEIEKRELERAMRECGQIPTEDDEMPDIPAFLRRA